MNLRRLSRKAAGVVFAVTVATSIVGYGESNVGKITLKEGGAKIAATKSSEAAGLLPEANKQSGQITIVMDATQGKPYTYYAADNSTIVGLTADLAKAIGQTLGVKVVTKNTSFDNLIPGLQAHRYDLAIAPMLMTDERLKRVDMIGWLHGGSAFLIADGGKQGLTPAKVCGMAIGAVTGSVEAIAMNKQSKKCVSAGKKAISIKLYPHAADGIVALTSGRLDAYDSASAQVAYIAKSNPQLKESGRPYSAGTSSMALPKNSPLAKAVQTALQHLIDTGVYDKILKSYGVQNLAVPSSSLNKPV